MQGQTQDIDDIPVTLPNNFSIHSSFSCIEKHLQRNKCEWIAAKCYSYAKFDEYLNVALAI